MKIVVLIKQVPDTADERTLDPATGWLNRDAGDNIVDEINERALETALRVKDGDKSTEVVVLAMGPEEAAKAIRKALSMGADSGIHILDGSLAGADAARTAAVLAAALKGAGADVIVAGNESTDGRGGVVPAMVAEHLGLPLVGSLASLELAPGKVSGERQGESGTLSVSAALPAVVTVTERSAEARFPNFKGILTAKRKPVATLSLSDLDVPATPAHTVIVSHSERPARTAGTKIVDEGNAGTLLADYLVENRLV
ncbi:MULTISPECIES: electron transfer flavoprotein subunit beta/FixA family protein [unclassified Arthrobacter]|uniref:electron transfer flavoprotein subunit beta/FixA family protein n=1 Tax=unclassified Arthrobacter TaxID=235627 RepID=UPI00159E021E|nr:MULTISPECIES: electron transfer flavoprotein subunit beta/FixA family protein [unclassified Arthrobacter]MCQ9163098.1 electron transfer flavoprotein subunit beta/FixA family protein [Arthrobacter sp. STN4]NVM97553.1 electron transfer flavoprotein subunit beta/FixA family protein [Arthrobacter sp. SDTb3-6]